MPTKEQETPSVIEKSTLDKTPIKNNDGEEIGGIFTGKLSVLTLEKLENQFDLDNIHPVMRELLRFEYDGKSVDDDVLNEEKNNAGWILNPTNEQGLAINLGSITWEPKAYKKAAHAIDLEHRKITKDDDGNVAVYREKKDQDGKPIPYWNSKTKELENRMEWTSQGKVLFTARNKTDIYNFVIHVNTMLDLEPQFDKERQRFIAGGGRTVTVVERKQQMVQTLQKPTTGPKTTRISGREFTRATLETLVANAEERGELGITDEQGNQ